MASKPKVLVVTALPLEYAAVREYLADLEEDSHPAGTIYEHGSFVGEITTWDVWIVEVGQGNSKVTLEVERGVTHIKPTLVLFVGVAGGIKDVALGDIVVATKVYGFESGKSEKGFKPRPTAYETPPHLLNRARVEARRPVRLDDSHGDAQVLLGAIAAGEKVISSTDSEAFRFIKNSYSDALAVEMEGYGCMLAAHSNGVPALIVRGISDLVDGKGESDSQGWQPRAAKHAARFAFDVLRKVNDVPQGFASVALEISWPVVQTLVDRIHRESESRFAPDVLVTMSGPGSFAACRRLAVGARDIPLLVAVTFPRSSDGSASGESSSFGKLADDDGWIRLASKRWDVFLPSVLRRFPEGSKVLVLDDRVLSGETQELARAELSRLGLQVRLGALIAPTSAKDKLDFIGRVEDQEYVFPWGPRDGRTA